MYLGRLPLGEPLLPGVPMLAPPPDVPKKLATPVAAPRSRPPLTLRTAIQAGTELLDSDAARAIEDTLSRGGGAREAAVAVLRTTGEGQAIEDEWRRQKMAELMASARRLAPWALGVGAALLLMKRAR